MGAPSQRQPLSNTPNRLSHHSRTPSPVIPAPPFPSFLRRQEPPAHPYSPLPQFIPPPFQGEARWGVGAPSQRQPLSNTPNRLSHHSRALSVIPAQAGTSCALSVIPAQAGTTTSPQPCYHTPRRTKVRAMPTSPNTDQPRAQTTAAHIAASLRTTPNKPEQIRTNPNTAKRPDQIGPPPESPPITPKKRKPRTAPPNGLHHRAAAASHAQAGCGVCCDGFRSTH